MRLKDKVIIVTGAASGMGLAMAELFTAEGAKVIAADWNTERLNAAVEKIKAEGGTIIGSQGDISKKETAEGLVNLAVKTFGKLDVLVNNAGIMDYMAGVGELSDDVWRRVMSINLDGPMFTMRKAVQQMLNQESGGSIINISSTAGRHGGAAGAAYTASKHALIGLTRSTAWMYAKRGIRTNAILPGGTATNIQESMPQEKLDITGAQRAGVFGSIIPGFLQPIDIANLALFLASDESKNINGALINADAGWDAV